MKSGILPHQFILPSNVNPIYFGQNAPHCWTVNQRDSRALQDEDLDGPCPCIPHPDSPEPHYKEPNKTSKPVSPKMHDDGTTVVDDNLVNDTNVAIVPVGAGSALHQPGEDQRLRLTVAYESVPPDRQKMMK